jgi:hypothetical protein
MYDARSIVIPRDVVRIKKAGSGKSASIAFGAAFRSTLDPDEALFQKDAERTAIQPALAANTKAPARIHVKQPLHDLLLAVQADSECAIAQAHKRSPERIESRVGFERQQCVEFAIGDLAVPKSFSRPLQLICLAKMFEQVGYYDEPHGTFASLHFNSSSISVPLSTNYQSRFKCQEEISGGTRTRTRTQRRREHCSLSHL